MDNTMTAITLDDIEIRAGEKGVGKMEAHRQLRIERLNHHIQLIADPEHRELLEEMMDLMFGD